MHGITCPLPSIHSHHGILEDRLIELGLERNVSLLFSRTLQVVLMFTVVSLCSLSVTRKGLH